MEPVRFARVPNDLVRLARVLSAALLVASTLFFAARVAGAAQYSAHCVYENILPDVNDQELNDLEATVEGLALEFDALLDVDLELIDPPPVYVGSNFNVQATADSHMTIDDLDLIGLLAAVADQVTITGEVGIDVSLNGLATGASGFALAIDEAAPLDANNVVPIDFAVTGQGTGWEGTAAGPSVVYSVAPDPVMFNGEVEFDWDDQQDGETITAVFECTPNSTPDLLAVTVFEPGAPAPVDDSGQTEIDTPVEVSVLDNDEPGEFPLDPSTLKVDGAPSNGTAEVTDDDTIRYTPDAGFSGDDLFTYEICDVPDDPDVEVRCASATVFVEVIDPAPETEPVPGPGDEVPDQDQGDPVPEAPAPIPAVATPNFTG